MALVHARLRGSDLFKVRELAKDADAMWDEVVKGSPVGTIFHTEEWLEILERNLNMTITRLAAVDNRNRIAGIFPFRLERGRLRASLFSPPVRKETPYGGPIALQEREDIRARLLARVFQTNTTAEIVLPPSLSEPSQTSLLRRLGGTWSLRSTYILDLSLNEDALWTNCEGSMRRAVRKARGLGVDVELSSGASDINDFYDLLVLTYARSGFKPHPRQFYYDVLDTLGRKGKAKLFFATVDGKRIASKIILMFKDRVNAWTACSDKDYWSYRPNDLLQWEVIRWAMRNGFSTYDLGGANIPSIAKFKKSAGGKLYHYEHIIWKGRFYSAIGYMLRPQKLWRIKIC